MVNKNKNSWLCQKHMQQIILWNDEKGEKGLWSIMSPHHEDKRLLLLVAHVSTTTVMPTKFTHRVTPNCTRLQPASDYGLRVSWSNSWVNTHDNGLTERFKFVGERTIHYIKQWYW